MSVLKRKNSGIWEVVGGGEAPPIQLGYAQVTANQAGITTQVDLTGLEVTVNVAAGRRIRITGQILYVNDTDHRGAAIAIMEGATQLNQANSWASQANNGGTAFGQVVLTPSAGSHTYKLRASRNGSTGTATMIASATQPAFILVEDITGGSGTPSGSSVAVVGATLSSGNVTLNGTSWANVATATDLTIAAAATDWLEVSLSGRLTAGSATSHTIFDIATIVSASPVNYFGVGGGASDEGLNGLRTLDTQDSPLTGSFLYQVQAGDISGGNVTLRLRYRQNIAGDRIFVAGSTNPFKWWVKNLG